MPFNFWLTWIVAFSVLGWIPALISEFFGSSWGFGFAAAFLALACREDVREQRENKERAESLDRALRTHEAFTRGRN